MNPTYIYHKGQDEDDKGFPITSNDNRYVRWTLLVVHATFSPCDVIRVALVILVWALTHWQIIDYFDDRLNHGYREGQLNRRMGKMVITLCRIDGSHKCFKGVLIQSGWSAPIVAVVILLLMILVLLLVRGLSGKILRKCGSPLLNALVGKCFIKKIVIIGFERLLNTRRTRVTELSYRTGMIFKNHLIREISSH